MKIKRKSIKSITIIAVLTVLLIAILCGCQSQTTSSTSSSSSHTHTLVHHEAVAATCTTSGNSEYWYCTDCGEYYADEKGMVLTSLSEVTIAKLGHTMTHHEAVAATCTASGAIEYWYCSTCEKYFTDEDGNEETTESDLVIAAYGHSLSLVTATEPTCTTTGNTAHYKCSRCEKLFSDNECSEELTLASVTIAATGHTKGECIERIDPTCEDTGTLEHYVCVDCGAYLDEDGEELSSIVIAANGHTLTGEWTQKVAATCTTAGTKGYRVCPVCDAYVDSSGKTIGYDEEDLVIAAYGHSCTHYAATEPTCTEEGHTEYWYCRRCKEYLSDNETYSTNYTDGESVVIAALGHNVTYTAGIEPTCTEEGNYEYWYCDRCEKYFADMNYTPYANEQATVIAALGHDYVFSAYVWDEYAAQAKLICSHDETHVTYVDATVTSEVTTAPTCTTTGIKTYTAIYGNEDAGTKTEVLSALGHDYVFAGYEWDKSIAGAFTAQAKYVCSHDEEHTLFYDAVVTSEITTEPTCIAYGTRTYTAIYEEESTGTETEAIDRLGHTLTHTAYVAPTCHDGGANGNIEYWYCETCEKYFLDDETYSENETTAEATLLEAPEHQLAVRYDNVSENTCTAGGHYDCVTYCTVCGDVISTVYTEVDALGHTSGEAVQENVVAATCTTAGSYDSVVYCTVCGEEISRTEMIVDALGHTSGGAVQENVVAATCTTAGSYDSVVYCTVCGEEVSRTEIVVDALGHDYVFDSYVWDTSIAGAYTAQVKLVCSHDNTHILYEDATVTSVVTTAATCTTTGVRTYTATYGDQDAGTKAETISALGHTFTHYEAKASTCTTYGNVEYWYCSMCEKCYLDDETYSENVSSYEVGGVLLAKTNHTYNDELTEAVAATCTTDGNYAYRYCTSCGRYYDEDGDCIGDSLDDVTISAYGHNYSNMVAAVDPTCTVAGTRSFCVCSGCQGIFVYENDAYVEVNESDLIIPATGHTYTAMTTAVAATCTENGSIAYCTCSTCGKYFDEDYEEISVGDITLTATGHTYVNGVCSVCGAVQGSLTISTEDGEYSYVKTNGYEVYTISTAGSYYISGDAEYAQLYVNAGDDDSVYLYLNGVSIENSADSVVYVNNADKVYLVAVAGTTNTLSDTRSASGTYSNGSAAVYSSCDLNVTKDSGTLIISSTYKNGIHTKKDLTIKKVTLTVTATNDALKGEKSIEIGSSAMVTAISAGGDGINTSDNGLKSSGTQEGAIDIDDGTVYVYANKDGIDSAYDVNISGSGTKVYVYTGDYATTKTGTAAVAGESAKGIKSENSITIADATVTVKAEEDGIHANAGTLDSGATTYGNITITSGTVTVELAEDDGIAADGTTTVSGGTITVNSYDNGVTGSDVAVSGGTLIVHSYSGDGVKSSSGDVTVTGGTLTVYAAYDGISANNSVNISGSSTGITVYTSTYSSYTNTSVASDAYLALTSASSSYWYAVYFYNSSTDYAWVTPTYKAYESSYYYYKFRSYASDYTYFTVYRFTSSVTEPSTSLYSAKSSSLTSSSYFTSSYNALKLSVSSSTISVTKTSYSSDSTKGIKSYNEINISGGTVYIKSYDDAIHANNDNGAGMVTISGGTFTIYTMDQGILADYSATISGGTVNITYAREGMQAVYLYFRGGTTTIYAYDDGINASQGSTSYTPCIYVYDGATLDITVPSGDSDGIDSNGNYTQTGGTVITRDATSDTSGNMSGFDIDGTCTITGGIFVCAGTPAELPSSSSQCYVKFSCGSSGMGGGGSGDPGGGGRPGSSSSSGSSSSTAYSFSSGTWYVKNSSGTTLFTFTLGTTYKGLWMSYSGFTTGSTYTITNGSTTYTWTQSSRATTVG